jgi:BASS family bile acid:Na+ symporter
MRYYLKPPIAMLRFLKSYMLPIAMCIGIVFYKFVTLFAGITPFLIFAMLFITYCKISFNEIRFEKFHFYLLAIQLLGSLAVYTLLYRVNPVVAQGSMICVLAPTATSAAVITGMLGGSIASLTAYSLLSNLCVAICAPIIFSYIGGHSEMTFLQSWWFFLREVGPLLILPFVCATALDKIAPRVRKKIQSLHNVSFYLWAMALTIVVGKTVSFILKQSSASYTVEIGLAACTFFICIGQFLVGRKIGKHYGQTVTGGQGLGQKNTVLTIWMALSYLDPISSIGPGAYVLWQNVVNSYQLWLKQRKDAKHKNQEC